MSTKRSVVFSDTQWALLRHQAKAKGESISGYVRAAAHFRLATEGRQVVIDREGRWMPSPQEDLEG